MFEELLKLVGDNAEAKKAIDAIQSTITTEQATQKATIESLNTQFNDAKESRDKYKLGNTMMKKALGIEKITEDTVKEKLEALTKGNESAQQLAEYTASLAEKDEEIAGLKSEYQGKFDAMRVDTEILKAIDAVSPVLVDDEMIRDAFKNIISKDIGIVGDGVSPFSIVGDQRVPVLIDGKPQSVADYTKSLLDSDRFLSFKKTSVGESAGSTGGTGGTSPKLNTKEADIARAKELINKR